MKTEQVTSKDLLSRLRQWSDTSWVHQLGIGDILMQQHKLADDCRQAADEIERLRALGLDLIATHEKETARLQERCRELERAVHEPPAGNNLTTSQQVATTLPPPDALWRFVRDIATGWDHDSDAHKYNTQCRVCDAEELLRTSLTKGDE